MISRRRLRAFRGWPPGLELALEPRERCLLLALYVRDSWKLCPGLGSAEKATHRPDPFTPSGSVTPPRGPSSWLEEYGGAGIDTVAFEAWLGRHVLLTSHAPRADPDLYGRALTESWPRPTE